MAKQKKLNRLIERHNLISQFVKAQSEHGIEPLRLFLEILREVRYVKLEKNRGIGPFN
jgi:hypothetical protein